MIISLVNVQQMRMGKLEKELYSSYLFLNAFRFIETKYHSSCDHHVTKRRGI